MAENGHKWWKRFLHVLSVVLMVSSIAVLIFLYFAPEKTAQIVMGAKIEAIGAIQDVQEKTTGKLPNLTYCTDGGNFELDNTDYACFVRMAEYEKVLPHPTLAIHNGWGGDDILSWTDGQKFTVSGVENETLNGEWIVVDDQDIYKYGTVDSLLPVSGDLLLQTCHYASPNLKILGAVRIEDYKQRQADSAFLAMMNENGGNQVPTMTKEQILGSVSTDLEADSDSGKTK